MVTLILPVHPLFILQVESSFFFERKAKIDDPVGAISVHGVNGAWGVISLGLFADGTYGDGWNGVAGTVKGLFYGDGGQLLAEIIGVLANLIYVGLISYAAVSYTHLRAHETVLDLVC